MPLRRVLGRVTPCPYGDTMTAHEVLTALLWLVLLGYLVYLGWFVVTTVAGWGGDTPDELGSASPPVGNDADLFELTQRPDTVERRAS